MTAKTFMHLAMVNKRIEFRCQSEDDDNNIQQQQQQQQISMCDTRHI